MAPPPGRLLVVGDVHGRAGALARLLRHLSELPPGGADRELVFLGDLIDRGPASLRALDLAWSARRWADRWCLLPGNHELMLLDALEALDAGPGAGDSACARMWRRNGGTSLLREVDPGGLLAARQALGTLRGALPAWFEPLMRDGPTHRLAGGFVLVHAGLDPSRDEAAFLAQPRRLADDAHWAWIREPFLAWRGGWGPGADRIVVHGHTPATFEPIRTPGEADLLLDRVATHRRLCLDAGAAGIEQVAAAEVVGDRYRLHVAPGPA